jgi:type II secretory pathway pseudopilin PulG
MRKKAFTLLELILVVAGIGIILTVVSLALFSKQKVVRDTKRVSDIKALESALQVVKNEKGSYEPIMCQLTSINACSAIKDSELNKYLVDLPNLKDPKNFTTPCTLENCATTVCNYSFIKILPNEYQVLFHLEKGVDELNTPGCYMLSEKGFKKLP